MNSKVTSPADRTALSDDDFIPWLLDSGIPTIRYLTLAQLCGRPAHDSQVLAAQQAIMREGPVPAILEAQGASGAWTGEHTYYTPKYVSTHWSLMLLVELAVDDADARFRRGVDFMLDNTEMSSVGRLVEGRLGLACFWGNLLRYAVHAGWAGDPRVERVVDYLVDDLQNQCRCEYNYGYACAWGAARALWGLAALPQCSPAVEQAIERGLSFLVDSHSPTKVDYPLPDQAQVHALWRRLNFPLFYQADVLFILRVLGELGALDRPGAQPALDWLAERRQRNGRWRGSSPFRQRTWREMGEVQETSRWVSLQSALVLQRAGRHNFTAVDREG